jgi:hypothetical protein
MAFAHFLAGSDDDALVLAEKALSAQVDYKSAIIIAVASCALLGRLAEAHKAVDRLRELDPALRIANLREWAPLRRREDLERLESGLRKGGLPEV